ncbi:MAG: hypothetical protein P4L79_10385 [Legionella sp.]|uniref:hypothetical protein n=1 Tax=Legionella sp. TaxID=459 RepID=UPI002848EBA2|nr:hypothetical protein [Legionella sp.]
MFSGKWFVGLTFLGYEVTVGYMSKAIHLSDFYCGGSALYVMFAGMFFLFNRQVILTGKREVRKDNGK